MIDMPFETPTSQVDLPSIALQFDPGQIQVDDGVGLSYVEDCSASSGEEKTP